MIILITEEQNKKLSTTLKKQYENGDRKVTISKAILKIREIMSDKQKKELFIAKLIEMNLERQTNKDAYDDWIAKRRATSMKKYGVEHWMKLSEYIEAHRKRHIGKKISEETRKKLSANSQKQTHRFSRCRGGFREDLKLYFRSSWEANYARYLNHINTSWEYEPTTFDLGEGYTYTPDFKLNDGSYIEIKGWLTEKGKMKLERFKSKYPDVKLILLDRNDYRKLVNEYKNIIPYWENVHT